LDCGIAFGAATASVSVFYPFTYVLISQALYGGSIANNLPPGASEDVLVGAALLGAGIMLIGIVYAFLEHLKS